MEIKAPHVEFKLAIAYAGTRDIVLATRRLCEKAKAGLIEPGAIDEALFDQELSTRGTPPPDFCIRTGGQIRLSGYLTWQFANIELYFTDIYGPEFTEDEFLKAIKSRTNKN
ncbi:uncharacterized protein [Spinacia oleracea]|uniref:Alkyl transferase n=1 Tax=Spinacia oleracea TaxID=3562 RepID=A0A9R0K8X2_SPIOL|nr:uncharacterized protein LOC110801024 [Spinacia oleracea]